MFQELFDTKHTFYPLDGPGRVTVFHTQTRRRNTIVAFLIQVENPRFTILYSHGNAVQPRNTHVTCVA